MLPEYKTGGGGSASSLLSSYGSLLGIDNMGSFNSNTNAIGISLYPEIAHSNQFLDSLLKTVVIDTTGEKIVFSTYLKDNLKIESVDMSSKSSLLNEFDFISYEENELYKHLRKNIMADLDKKTGKITLSFTTYDPIIAAQITQNIIQYLTKYIESYYRAKSLVDLKFLQDRYAEVESRYRKASEILSLFIDSNKNIVSATAKLEETMLRSDFDLAYSLKTSLEQRIEQAKFKVQEETPVFTILQRPTMSMKKTAPARAKIVIFTLIALFFIAISYGVVRYVLSRI